MIDAATVQRIKDAADIVEVVSDYVSLTRRGSNYMGLCPFHNERTPSFSVNKARNFCYCFSCKKGGSPVNFIMEKEGISYYEALLQLAKKYGIKVEERELTDEERELQTLRESMFIANEWAMKYFEKNLRETQEGRDIGLKYLYQRGITDEAINAFHLGYAIDSFDDFWKAAISKGFNEDVLKAVGLVGVSQQGKLYDRFKGRVIFPIMNSSGKVIAFGGRDLKGGMAKYINSPETEIYKKSNELYGIYNAKSAISRDERCYLVEGYLDVISMWQSGLKNVVASSGTALTDGQIALIHRFSKNVTLTYDGDNAGIKASLRGIDMLLSHQLDLNVLLLPEGEDPDSFAQKNTPEALRDYFSRNQTDIIQFKIKTLLDESDNPQKKTDAIKSVATSIAHIPDKVKRDVYVKECSRLMGVSENSLIGDVARLREQIISQERMKRQRAELNRRFPVSENPPSSTLSNKYEGAVFSQETLDSGINYSTTLAQNGLQPKPAPQINKAQSPKPTVNEGTFNPLYPLEWKVLEYCLKYGYLKLWDNEEEDQAGDMLTVEFVKEELDLDGIDFSVNDFKHIFLKIISLTENYREQQKEFSINLLKNLESRREGLKKEITEKGMSFSDIERAEKKLEEENQLYFEKEMKEFAKNFSVREFASSEDPIIRHYSNKAFFQPHQLSNIFRRDGNVVAEEEDKILQLILTALNVWKNGLLDLQLNQLLDTLRHLPESTPMEEMKEIQGKIAALLQARSRMAKDIGERIISPK